MHHQPPLERPEVNAAILRTQQGLSQQVWTKIEDMLINNNYCIFGIRFLGNINYANDNNNNNNNNNDDDVIYAVPSE